MLSSDDGVTSQPLRLGLPTVAVHDLVVKGNDLVLATMGRSLWIFDDLTPIREMSARVRDEDVHLFMPEPAIRWRVRNEWHGEAGGEPGAAQNPPLGALVYYYLKRKPQGEIRLEIVDPQGGVIRTLRSTAEPAEYPPDDPDEPKKPPKPSLGTDPGVQRAVWDLAFEGARKIKGAKIDEGDADKGPLVVPGTYTARLVVDGKTYTAPVVVRPDPRVTVPQQDLADQVRFALEVRDQISRLTGIAEDLRSVRRQLGVRSEVWKTVAKAGGLVAGAQALTVKLDTLEARLQNPRAEVTYDILAQRGGAQLYSRLIPLFAWVVEADGPPTQGMRDVFEGQKQELDTLEGEFRGLIANDLAALNRTARELNLADVAPPDAAPAR
jgi:hypothetical protein